MAAYIVTQVEIRDPRAYEDYRKMVQPSLDRYGGKFLVRGGRVETLEGTWKPSRFVIIEFESADKAKQWWASEEYREAKNLRHKVADSEMIVVEGVGS